MICYLLIFFCVVEYLKKRYVGSLIIFFFLLLDGFQVIPMKILTVGYYSGSTIDAALLAFLILFLIRGSYWLNSEIKNTGFVKAIWLFIIVLIANMIYGVMNGYAFGDVFKGARLYLFLLSFLMFTEIPVNDVMKVIRVLIIIVFFQSILFVLQVVTGKTLLQGPEALVADDLNYTRFYNSPKLLEFALAVCLFWFPFKRLKNLRIFFISIFALAVLAPLHRGLIASWFLTFGLYALLFNSYAKKALYISLIFGLAVVVLSVDILRNRMFEAFDQITIVGDILSNKTVYDSNTFIYRINHFTERLNYVSTLTFGWLFGIGLVDEKSPLVAHLPLQYGLPDPKGAGIIKVYTPDLVWSMIFLTMGYVGTFLYINIYVNLLRKYSRNIVSVEISKVIFTLILIGFFSSFTSNTMLQPHFFVPILILTVIIEMEKKIKRLSEIAN